MIYESQERIAEYLRSNRNFEECLLVDVRWKHFGTVIELEFDYTWGADGSVRPEYAPIDLKSLVLRNVQELHVCNALNERMSLHPEELNWGLSEVSSVRVLDENQFLSKYQSLAIPLHHLRCNWEGRRRLDVVFSTLEVV
jgi:hypothetical protein